MGEAEREGRLSRFRSGALSILVATSSLEEGLDIPECNLVVRYDKVLTTKSHVQGSGRARCPHARVVLFQNQALAEEEKRQEMEAVARDVSIALSSTDIEARLAVETARQQKAGMPYPFLHPAAPHAEVNVFNATLVVHQYIQKTMGQGFLPNVHLFHQRLDSLGGCPPVVRAVLLAASYPSPDGVVVVHALQVLAGSQLPATVRRDPQATPHNPPPPGPPWLQQLAQPTVRRRSTAVDHSRAGAGRPP
jgi:hypothetical protein